MAESKYSKYVFRDFFPEGGCAAINEFSTSYKFKPEWHKADFTNQCTDITYHYKVGGDPGVAKKNDEADTCIMFLGTDPKREGQLGGTYEFWLGLGDDAEKYVFDTCSVIYIPAGVYYGPQAPVSIDDPTHPIAVFTMVLAKDDKTMEALDEAGKAILPTGDGENAEKKYAKYVFNNMGTAEEMMHYTIPHYEGKNVTYIFDEMWHKADFQKTWCEADVHRKPGAWVGGGTNAYATIDGPTFSGSIAKAGDPMFKLGPHRHKCDEIFHIMGTDPSKPGQLGGKYVFWLGVGEEAEKFEFTTNTVVYNPAGVTHNPHTVVELDDPDHPIIVYINLLNPGHYGDTSIYPYDENGKLIFPPGFEEIDGPLDESYNIAEKEVIE